MHLIASSLIRCLAAATVIALVLSIVRAQSPASSLPSVLQPAEGQTVTGDLEIKVQVPARVSVRKYTIEAAYWDAAQRRWVHPGTLRPDFGGEYTQIASNVRTRFGSQATRWRVRLRSSDPPGSWGPWREFTWQGAPSAPVKSARPVSASAPTPASPSVAQGDSAEPAVQDDTIIQQIGSTQAKIADSKAKIAELMAQCDAQIAAAKKAIVQQNLTIAGLKSQIIQLQADLKKHQALLQEILQQQPAPAISENPKFKEWIEKVTAALNKEQQYLEEIEACENQIKYGKDQITSLEKKILELEQEKAQLAKM